MRCLSCNIGEFDWFGESTYIQEGYCAECRKVSYIDRRRNYNTTQ